MIIPRVGDVWEFKLPGKRKKRKEIGAINMQWYRRQDGSLVQHPRVEWKRLPKGRYSGLRVKWLLMYGTRISTKSERDSRIKSIANRNG